MMSFVIKFILHFIICVQFVSTENIFERGTKTQLDDERYPIVTVSQGQLQGLRRQTTKGNTYYSFKGIPYAEPPVGSLRFRDPVAVNNWNGVFNAFEDVKVCTQFVQISNISRGEEDCLYLNVFTPSIPTVNADNKHPVVIYIHGGGFTDGSGTENDVSPAIFLDNGVVFIAMNYRLNIFGFLSLDIPEVPGNAALKDQLLAIKWVKENIVHFNGDTDNITICGTSAGSASVDYQLLHSESQGLFHRASMQSGSSLSSWSRPRNPEMILKKLVDVIGGANEPYEILNRLNQLSTNQLLQIAERLKDEETLMSGLIFTAFVPVVEKSFPEVQNFLTRDPLEIYGSGDFVKVPSLISFCKDEGNMFPFLYGESLVSEIINRQYANFMSFISVDDKESVNGNLTALYSAMNISEDDQVNEFLSDLMFFSGIYQTLKHVVRDVSNEHYSYLFSVPMNITVPGLPPVSGSPHTLDMYFLLFAPEDTLNEEQLRMKDYLEIIYMNFIRNGNPTSSGNVSWSPTNEESFNVLDISGDSDNVMILFPFSDRMKYWDSLFN